MKWKKDEPAKMRELAVALPADKIKIAYRNCVSRRAVVYAVRKMYYTVLLNV